MKLWISGIIFFFYISTNNLYAQRNSSQDGMVSWATQVIVDGNLNEWGDSLSYQQHDSQNLLFQIKNDDKHLYVAIRVKDRDRQMQALSQGFSFTVNTEGRKRSGPTVTYPIADRISYRSIMSTDNEDRPEDMRIGALKAIRSIYVSNFDDIVDGQISLENQYGIQAEVNIDTTDALCFEAKIPINRLGIAPNHNKPIAFNIKINGIIMPTSRGNMNTMRRNRYGYGAYPYGYGSNTPSKPREEPGKWVISKLAQTTTN